MLDYSVIFLHLFIHNSPKPGSGRTCLFLIGRGVARCMSLFQYNFHVAIEQASEYVGRTDKCYRNGLKNNGEWIMKWYRHRGGVHKFGVWDWTTYGRRRKIGSPRLSSYDIILFRRYPIQPEHGRFPANHNNILWTWILSPLLWIRWQPVEQWRHETVLNSSQPHHVRLFQCWGRLVYRLVCKRCQRLRHRIFSRCPKWDLPSHVSGW